MAFDCGEWHNYASVFIFPVNKGMCNYKCRAFLAVLPQIVHSLFVKFFTDLAVISNPQAKGATTTTNKKKIVEVYKTNYGASKILDM